MASIHNGFVIWQKHLRRPWPLDVSGRLEQGAIGPWLDMKVGPYLSAEWAQQFPFAPAVGLLLGAENGIAELDVDTSMSASSPISRPSR